MIGRMRSLVVLAAAAGWMLTTGSFPASKVLPGTLDAGEPRGMLRRVHAQAKPKLPDANLLSLEVSALRSLRTLQATPAQMKALQGLHQKEFIKNIKREPAKVTAKYRKTLVALRDALAQDNDDDVKSFSEKLEILKDEDEEVFDAVETTPAASEPARTALRLFSSRQILAFMKANEDDLADPADVLVDALEEGLTATKDQWTEIRDDAVKQVTWMLSGLAPKAPTKVQGEAQKWLDSKHALKAEEFKSQRSALEAEATKTFTNRVSPTVLLTNFAWHGMAELLCNPRLQAALRARLNGPAAGKK